MNWSVKWEKFISTMQNERFQQDLLEGLCNTVEVAVLGLLIGILIGSLIAVIKVAPKYKLINRVLDKICSVYVAIFRGTPIVVQLLLAYYVILPTLEIRGVGSLTVGVIVFGMNSGAYVSEIMRRGLNSVDIGQMEAGRALGLSYSATMIKIIIPQAIKNILPTLGNEFITLIKETAVVGYVGAMDITKAFQDQGANTYEYMIPYLVMAALYIVIVAVIASLVKLMERRLAKSERRS